MKSSYEDSIDAEEQERQGLEHKSIPQLQALIAKKVLNLDIPCNKELLIDIVIDLMKENKELQ